MNKKLIDNKGKKRVLAGELFGKYPELTSKKTAQELKDEARKGWD